LGEKLAKTRKKKKKKLILQLNMINISTDIISFLLVTKVLGNIPCLAFDDDFEKLGLTVVR